MPYQRDSLIGFLHYWARFTFGSWFELPVHALRKGMTALFVQAVLSPIVYFSAMYWLWQQEPVAAFFTMVLPWVITSFALMFGNWSQHIFVDPTPYAAGMPDPLAINYSLAYNNINHSDNGLTFNDGYHIIHHCWATLHWSNMPQRFMDDIANHAKNDAFIFDGISVFDVGVMVFSGRLDKLAEHYVHYGQTPTPRSKDQIVAELRRRLVPIDAPDAVLHSD